MPDLHSSLRELREPAKPHLVPVEPIFAPISSSIEADPVSIISVEKSYEPAYPSGVVGPLPLYPNCGTGGRGLYL